MTTTFKKDRLDVCQAIDAVLPQHTHDLLFSDKLFSQVRFVYFVILKKGQRRRVRKSFNRF